MELRTRVAPPAGAQHIAGAHYNMICGSVKSTPEKMTVATSYRHTSAGPVEFALEILITRGPLEWGLWWNLRMQRVAEEWDQWQINEPRMILRLTTILTSGKACSRIEKELSEHRGVAAVSAPNEGWCPRFHITIFRAQLRREGRKNEMNIQ